MKMEGSNFKSVIKAFIYRLTLKVKFVPVFDLPKGRVTETIILKGHPVYNLSNKFLYTYADKKVTLFKKVSFWANTGIVIYNEAIVLNTYLSQSLFERYNIRKINFKSNQHLKLVNATCLGDYPYGIFYHFMVDTLPRIYSLYSPPLSLHDKIDVVIPDFFSEEFKQMLIKLLPDNSNPIWINPKLNTLITAENYYHLPYFTEDSKGYLPEDVLKFYKTKIGSQLNINWPAIKDRNIYISRQKGPKRKFDNEYLLVELLKEYRYETYFLEDLTLKEQIALIASAKNIITIHGAGLTNLLWTSGTNVLEIFPSTNHNAWQYEYLCVGTKNNYHKITLDQPSLNDNVVLNDTTLVSIKEFIQKCAE
jgi:hypothetical protein